VWIEKSERTIYTNSPGRGYRAPLRLWSVTIKYASLNGENQLIFGCQARVEGRLKKPSVTIKMIQKGPLKKEDLSQFWVNYCCSQTFEFGVLLSTKTLYQGLLSHQPLSCNFQGLNIENCFSHNQNLVH